MFGLLGIVINLFQDKEISTRVPAWVVTAFHLPWPENLFALGPRLWPALATNNFFGMVMFVVLIASLFYFARKKLD